MSDSSSGVQQQQQPQPRRKSALKSTSRIEMSNVDSGHNSPSSSFIVGQTRRLSNASAVAAARAVERASGSFVVVNTGESPQESLLGQGSVIGGDGTQESLFSIGGDDPPAPVAAAPPPGETEGSWHARTKGFFDVEKPRFNMLVGAVVVSNAVVIGLETDLGVGNFVVCEHIFVVLFLAECMLRVHQLGIDAYLDDSWHVFDCVLVALGVLDLWILPLVTLGSHSKVRLSNLTSLRLLRLMRILRLVRVLRIFRLFSLFSTLALLSRALGKAFQVVASLCLVVGILDYVLAILLTQAAGHEAKSWGDKEQEITQHFGTIGASMRTLFQIMTLDEWIDIVDTLSEQLPGYPVSLGFVSYIIFASYTLTCLVTALLSSQLMQQHHETQEQRQVKVEERRKSLAMDLRSLISQIVSERQRRSVGFQMHDESPLIQAHDLRRLLDLQNELPVRLQECDIKIGKEGILYLVDQLTINDMVSIEYFVEKLTNLAGSAKAGEVVDVKHLAIHGQLQLMHLQARVAGLEQKMKRDIAKLARKVDDMMP